MTQLPLSLIAIVPALILSGGSPAVEAQTGAHPRHEPFLLTVLNETTLFADLRKVSQELHEQAELLLKEKTPENHRKLAEALVRYLSRKGFKVGEVRCTTSCYVPIVPAPRKDSHSWLQKVTNNLARDPILPSLVGFDTSFVSDGSAFFDSESDPPRTALDWVDLATSVMSSVSGHEVRHWKHEQFRVQARRSKRPAETYRKLLKQAGFLPANSFSHWRKGIRYFNPEIEKTYGSQDGFALEEVDTNFYNARREITFAEGLWKEPVLAQIGTEKAWEFTESQITTALQYFEISEALIRVADLILQDFIEQLKLANTTVQLTGSGPSLNVEVKLPSGSVLLFPLELFVERAGTGSTQPPPKALLLTELKGLKIDLETRDNRNMEFYRELIALFKQRHPEAKKPGRVRALLKELISGYPDIVQAYDHKNPDLPVKKVRNRPRDP